MLLQLSWWYKATLISKIVLLHSIHYRQHDDYNHTDSQQPHNILLNTVLRCRLVKFVHTDRTKTSKRVRDLWQQLTCLSTSFNWRDLWFTYKAEFQNQDLVYFGFISITCSEMSLSVWAEQWMSNYNNFCLNCVQSLLSSSRNYKEPTEELLKVYKKYYCCYLTNTIKKER